MILGAIIMLVGCYFTLALLMDWNFRCPFGHKWHYWQLIGGVSKTRRRVCKRCKIERGVKGRRGKEKWNVTYPKGEYDLYKHFAPIDSNIIKRFYIKHINKRVIIINYRGYRIKIKNY